MNDVILEMIEIIKNDDVRKNKFELKVPSIREEYSIYRSFCSISYNHDQNRNTP